MDEVDKKIIALLRVDLLSVGRSGSFFSDDGKPKKRAREIGKMLNELGGLELMHEVSKVVVTQLQMEGIIAGRELEHCWHGIGDWLA